MDNIGTTLSLLSIATPVLIASCNVLVGWIRRRNKETIEKALRKKQMDDMEKKMELLPCQANAERIAKLECSVAQYHDLLVRNEKLINMLEQQAKMFAARQQ